MVVRTIASRLTTGAAVQRPARSQAPPERPALSPADRVQVARRAAHFLVVLPATLMLALAGCAASPLSAKPLWRLCADGTGPVGS
jgi:hypothetical protein